MRVVRSPVVSGPVVCSPVVRGPVVCSPVVRGPVVCGPVVSGPVIRRPVVHGRESAFPIRIEALNVFTPNSEDFWNLHRATAQLCLAHHPS